MDGEKDNQMDKKYSAKNILLKATLSSTNGYLISTIVNILILNWVDNIIQHHHFIVAGIIIGAPFCAVSIARIFIIDWVYQKYGIILEPVHLLWRWWKS